MTPEQAAQLIESRLFPNPSLAARAAIREVAGEIVSRVAKATDVRITAMLNHKPHARAKREGIPMHISAVDACATAVGMNVDKSAKRQHVPEMRAIAWMLRRGIAFPYTPSLPEIASALGYATHTVVIEHLREAQQHPELIAAMYDYCESFGMKMHPRPGWAKRKEVA